MSRRARDRRDRRQARREAYERDKAQAKAEGSLGRKSPLKPEAELEELGVKQFRPVLGKNESEHTFAVRLLPFHQDDPDRLGFPLYIHYGVGPEGDAFLCPVMQSEVFREFGMEVPEVWRDARCPVCEEYERELERYKKVRDELGEEDRKKAYAKVSRYAPYTGGFTAKKPKSMLVFLVDASSPEAEAEGVQVYLMPYWSVYVQGVLEQGEDPDTGEFVDLQDPEEEMVFFFKRIGTGQTDTKYFGYRTKRKPWRVEDWEDIVDSVPRVMDVLHFASYDEIMEAMSGVPVEESDGGNEVNGEDVEEGPVEDEPSYRAERRSGGRRRPRSAEDDEKELEEEPPKPPRRDKDDDETELAKRVERLRRKREELRRQARRRAEEDDPDVPF